MLAVVVALAAVALLVFHLEAAVAVEVEQGRVRALAVRPQAPQLLDFREAQEH